MSPIAVLLTLFAYLAVLFTLAYISGRHADNAGFFIGNRRTTWYMATLAMIGAAMSGVTFISVPGSVAADSFSYMQMTVGFTIGQMIVAFVLVPVFYRHGVVSLYQYLNDRFGITTHRTGAWCFFVSKIIGSSLKIYVVCAVMQLLVFDHFNLPFIANILFTMLLDQDMMQRNLSCRTMRDSQINIVLTALCQIVVILLFLALGALIYLYIAAEGLPQPAKGDQAFALVAVQGGLPKIAGIMFVVGLVSCTYSAAGSALTALTTSFTLDILRADSRDEKRLERLRKRTHIVMAAIMTAVILIFDRFGNDSVINLVFKVAGYTYGPILGLFVFGLATRRKIHQRFVPLIAVASPVASYLLQWWAAERWNYAIGFELLGYNALFCIFGLFLISYPRNETAQ